MVDDSPIAGSRKAVEEVGDAYDLAKARDNLVAVYPGIAHDFPDDVREVYKWLDREL